MTVTNKTTGEQIDEILEKLGYAWTAIDSDYHREAVDLATATKLWKDEQSKAHAAIQKLIEQETTRARIDELEALKGNTGYTINDFYPSINERLTQLSQHQEGQKDE